MRQARPMYRLNLQCMVFNVQNSIYLRKYAEENSENICTIPWGEPVGYIEDVTNGFYKIKYKGQIGYAKAEYLTSTDPHVYTGGNPIYHISGVQNSVYLRKITVRAGGIHL